jgi:hypothetical protein
LYLANLDHTVSSGCDGYGDSDDDY